MRPPLGAGVICYCDTEEGGRQGRGRTTLMPSDRYRVDEELELGVEALWSDSSSSSLGEFNSNPGWCISMRGDSGREVDLNFLELETGGNPPDRRRFPAELGEDLRAVPPEYKAGVVTASSDLVTLIFTPGIITS